MESLYKVGDIVKIKQLSSENDTDYRFGVNSDMAEQSGKTFEIERVSTTLSCEGRLPDDGFCYRLKGIGWAWASSMFEAPRGKKSTKSKSEKSKIKISFHKKRELKFNFSL